MDIPEVRYAKTADGVHIAYQIVGEGPVDLLFVPGFWSNLTWNWQLPSYAQFLRRLSSFCRLIVVDRRGSGLSDRLSPHDLPALEILADDLGVVLDAAGSERASLLGVWSGGHTCSVFAATRPERVDRLILYAMNPGGDQSWGVTWDREGYLARVAEGWGTRSFARWDPAWGLSIMAPSVGDDPRTIDWYVASLQFASDPGAAIALSGIYAETDVQPILPSIRVPTLLPRPRGRPARADHHLQVPRGSHPGGPAGGAVGRGRPVVRRRHRLDRRCDPGVRHRRSPCDAIRSGARDRPVHRHRRIDRVGGPTGGHRVEGATPGRSSSRGTMWEGSRCTSAPGSPTCQAPARCSFPPRSKTSLPAPGSFSRTAASTS